MTIETPELTKLIQNCFDIDSDIVSMTKVINTAKSSLRQDIRVSDIIRIIAQEEDFDIIFVSDGDSEELTACLWDQRKMNAAIQGSKRNDQEKIQSPKSNVFAQVATEFSLPSMYPHVRLDSQV